VPRCKVLHSLPTRPDDPDVAQSPSSREFETDFFLIETANAKIVISVVVIDLFLLEDFKTVSKLDRPVAVLKYRERLKIQGLHPVWSGFEGEGQYEVIAIRTPGGDFSARRRRKLPCWWNVENL
jgi:hypothetical protein